MNTITPNQIPDGVAPGRRGNFRSLKGIRRGSTLPAVMVILTFLATGLGTYLFSLRGVRSIQDQRVMGDRGFMAAEAGLAKAISKLSALNSLPTAKTTWSMDVPTADFWPFQSVTVNVFPSVVSGQQAWTLVSTAVSDSADKRHVPQARRAQATFVMQNFSRYDMFVNNYGGVIQSGYYHFEGFGETFLGPFHCNTGLALWPNFWVNKETTSSASMGTRYFANWSSYNVSDANANNYVNILNYYNSTYGQAPKFYGGLSILPAPISLPADMSTDPRALKLRQNAGLSLPAGYSGYDATKGPNFTVDLVTTTTNAADSTVVVKQYLGTSGGVPTYGPARTFNIDGINNAMIVYGNIKSLKGTLRGNLTIAAMKSPTTSGTGGIDITGNLEYATRKANASFQYSNTPSLYTNGGADINMTTVDTLLNQASSVTDSLGLISETDIFIKEKDLNGNLVAAGSTPLYVDGMMMATGANSGSAQGGQFGPENSWTRATGTVYLFGGSVQNYMNGWAMYSGSTLTNGLIANRLWDNRNYVTGLGPPSYPITGVLSFYGKSWLASSVKSASDSAKVPPTSGTGAWTTVQ